MKKVSVLILLLISTFFLYTPMGFSQTLDPAFWACFGFGEESSIPGESYLPYSAVYALMSSGYTCICNPIQASSLTSDPFTSFITARHATCTKTYAAGYGASAIDDYTLNGFQNFITNTLSGSYQLIWNTNSPFLYLHHPPEGTVSISLSSTLDKYFPKPAFNQKNGWQVQAKDDTLSVNGVQEPHLFYELATPSVTLTRKGRNFSSKADVVSFLKDSDFFTRLGFSPEEKQNSLSYLLPKIASIPATPNYYLTILTPSAIENISRLDITPAPTKTIRHYLALYPNSVPVQTTGDFVYPQAREEGNSFVAKETGEIVVTEGMVVFFR